MARFLFWSDLHLEKQAFELPDRKGFGGPIDGVLIAGDTDTGISSMYLHFARRVWEAYGVPVVMVLGNHEYHGCEMTDLHRREEHFLREARLEGADIRILHGDSTQVGETRIIGATLWTDFECSPLLARQARAYAAAFIEDFSLIKLDDGTPRRFTVEDAVALHHRQKRSILGELSKPWDGSTVVMTHHVPIFQCVHSKYALDVVHPAFANNMLSQIRELRFDAWIFGHSHENYEQVVNSSDGQKVFLSNPRGYRHEATRFDPARILEV